MCLGKLKLNVVQMHWQQFHKELCLLLIEAVVAGLLVGAATINSFLICLRGRIVW